MNVTLTKILSIVPLLDLSASNNKHQNNRSSNSTLTLDEKSSKSLSLAMNKEEAARRARVEGAGEKAAEYLSADAASVVIMRELKDVMVVASLLLMK